MCMNACPVHPEQSQHLAMNATAMLLKRIVPMLKLHGADAHCNNHHTKH